MRSKEQRPGKVGFGGVALTLRLLTLNLFSINPSWVAAQEAPQHTITNDAPQVVVLGDSCYDYQDNIDDLVDGDLTFLESGDIGLTKRAAPYRNFAYGVERSGHLILFAGYWDEGRSELCAYVIRFPPERKHYVENAIGSRSYERVLSGGELEALDQLRSFCASANKADRLAAFPGGSRFLDRSGQAVVSEDWDPGDCAKMSINAAASVRVMVDYDWVRVSTIGEKLFILGE